MSRYKGAGMKKVGQVLGHVILFGSVFSMTLAHQNTLATTTSDVLRNGIFDRESLPAQISRLQRFAANGDVDAGGFLSFALALGLGINQDLKESLLKAVELSEKGSIMAHTTLAFLLRHNYTGAEMTDEERASQSVVHSTIAAVKGDSLSQMIVGGYHFDRGECEPALTYYRKAAFAAMRDMSETEILNIETMQYIYPQDSPFFKIEFPDEDQVEFMVYLGRNGDDAAALNAAHLLFDGSARTKKDRKKSLELLQISADAGNSKAKTFLAMCIIRGTVNGSDEDALKYLQTALKEDQGANTGLGILFMEGRGGLPRDLRQANEHFKAGAEAGSLFSFYLLGMLYESPEGPGTPDDAVNVFRLTSVVRHGHSMWRLAENHWRQISSNNTPINDIHQKFHNMCPFTVNLYKMIALSGPWKGLFDLAYDEYENGIYEAAMVKYLFLSDLGYTAARVNSARLYETYIQRPNSCQLALSLWQKAANEDVPVANLELGKYFYEGRFSSPDLVLSKKFFSRATQLGLIEGGFNLVWMTEWGMGEAQDLTEAKSLYEKMYDNFEEAQAPILITLARVELFEIVKKMIFLDLYKVDWALYSNIIRNNFDIFIISVLSIFVCARIFFSRRTLAPAPAPAPT